MEFEISLENYITEDIQRTLSTEAKESFKKVASEKERFEYNLLALKEKHENLELDFQQRTLDLEERCQKTNSDYLVEVKKNEELCEKLKRFVDQSSLIDELQQKCRNWENLVDSLQSRVDCLSVEKQDLNQILESRTSELSYLSDENKRLVTSLKDAVSAKIEAQANFERARSSEDNHRFESSQFRNQIELLNSQVEKQADELMSKHDEIQRLRREKIFAASDVQRQLDSLKDEHELVKRKLDDSNKLNKQYETQVAKYIDKLRDAEEYNTGLESHYQKEMENQSKLAELYKKANEEAENKNKNLINAVSELQSLVSQYESQRNEAEVEKLKACGELDSVKEKTSAEIDRLKTELNRANELIEMSRKSKELIEMSPSAEAISKTMKSGLTFSDLYSRYVDATQSLDNEKAENKRLKATLDEIVDEIQQKTPAFLKLKEDHEKMLAANSELAKKLDDSMVQSQKTRLKLESLQRASDYLRRQNDSLEQMKTDFCQQLQSLIRENTVLKGGTVVDDRNDPGDVDSIVNSSFSNDSDKVISLNLVKYTDIIDLQVKNTQLLAALRSISDEKEVEQEGKFKTKIETLEMKLKYALEDNERYQDEVSKMKELLYRGQKLNNSSRLQESFENLTYNEFKDNLHNSAIESSISEGSEVSSRNESSTRQTQQGASQISASAIMSEEERKSFQSVIEELKQEIQEWKEEAKKSEIAANERCFEYQKENSNLRLQNSKLSSQSQTLNEKVKLQELNENVLQKELDSYRKQVNAMSSTHAKMQVTIDVLTADVKTAQEKFTTANVQLQSLRSEKDVWKNTEKHLTRERDRLLEEKKVQNNLLANIDSLRNALDYSSSEQQIRYQKTIGSLQANLEAAQKKNREIETEKRSAVKDYEERLKALSDKLKVEMEGNQKLTSDLEKVKSELTSLEVQLKQTPTSMDYSGVSVYSKRNSGANDLELENESGQMNISQNLERFETEVEILKTQKRTLEDHLENYKQMCEASEEKYNTDTSQLKGQIASLEDQIKSFNESQSSQITTVAKLEADNAKLKEELKLLADNSDSSRSKITLKCDNLESQLSKSLGVNNALKVEIESLKSQLDDKTENLSVLSEKLECSSQKLTQGSSQFASMETQLVEKTREVESLKSRIESMGIEIEGFKSQVEFNMNSYKTKEATWSNRLKDLETQNQILLDEIDKLGSLMSKTKTSVLDSSFSDSMMGEIPENPPPGTENLLELVRHLRREKDIYLTKYEVNQGECDRAKQKLEFTQKRVTELESMLNEEEERHQELYQMMANQEELSKKNDQVLVLQDSNAFLRKESARLQEELEAERRRQKQAEEAALKPLRDEIENLKANAEAHLSEVEIMTDEITKWKARNNELLERITKIDSDENKKILAKAKDFENKNLALTVELKNVESRMFAINKEKNDIVEKYKASSTEANLLRSAKNSLEAEKGALQKQVESLKAKITGLESEMVSKKASVEELANLKSKYTKLVQFAKQKSESLTKVNKETDELKGQLASLEKQNEDLMGAKTALEEQLKLNQQQNQQQQPQSSSSTGESSGMGVSSGGCEHCITKEADNFEARSRSESLEWELKKLKLQLDESKKRCTLLEQTLNKTVPSGSDNLAIVNDLKYKNIQNQNELLKKELELAKQEVAKGELRSKKMADVLQKFKKRIDYERQQYSSTQKDLEDRKGELAAKEDELKKVQEECEKIRKLCLTYENKIEALETKVEALETAAKAKPREVRLGYDDTPSTPQPTLAVSGQQRSDKLSDRPSANIKPMTSQPRAQVRPQAQATVVHVQPLQTMTTNDSTTAEPTQASTSASSSTSPNVFASLTLTSQQPQSARVVPQVRTVGEISSAQTPPHSLEFAVHTSAASSTTLEASNIEPQAVVAPTVAAPVAMESPSVASSSSGTAAAFVLPIARSTINLPTSSSDRADTTAAIQPYNVHPAPVSVSHAVSQFVTAVPPVAQISPEQQQQEISSTHQSLSATPMIGPFSSNRVAGSSSNSRGDVGPADSSHSSKRPRETFATSEDDMSAGKRARVVSVTSDEPAVVQESPSESQPVQETANEVVETETSAPPVADFSQSTINFAALASSSFPDIPSSVYEAIATISSTESSEVVDNETADSMGVSGNNVANEASEVVDDSNVNVSISQQQGESQEEAEDINAVSSIVESNHESQYEEIEEQVDEDNVVDSREEEDDECEVMNDFGESERIEEDDEMRDQNEADDEEDDEETEEDVNEDIEEDEDDGEVDDVICLSDEENDQEPQFASLEPHEIHSMHSTNEHRSQDLEQDEINAYDEEESSLQANALESRVGNEFNPANTAEGEVGIIVTSEQPQIEPSNVETYNIEAMESSSNAQTALMTQNNDNPVWTRSPDRLQGAASLEADSAPQSPSMDALASQGVTTVYDGNDATVTSSSHSLDLEASELPQLRSLENVARKTVRPGRPRLRRNPNNQLGQGGSDTPGSS